MYFQTTSPYNVTSVIAFNWLTISNYSVAHVTWIWGDCLDDLGPEAHFIGKCVVSEKRWPLYEPHVCWMPVWYLESYSTLLHLHFIICKMGVSEQCLGYQLLCNKPPQTQWLTWLTNTSVPCCSLASVCLHVVSHPPVPLLEPCISHSGFLGLVFFYMTADFQEEGSRRCQAS